MENKTLNLKLSTVYFVVCGSMACYFPFMAVYFENRGLKYSQIGILFAVNSLVSVIAQPMWGIITDKYSNKRRIFMLTLVLSSIAIFGFILAKSFMPVFIALVIYMIFQSPLMSIMDAYCYEVIDSHKGLQYGRIRLMGSLGYAVIALILAQIVKSEGINSSYIAYVLLAVAGAFMIYSIKYKGKPTGSNVNYKDFIYILRNNRFIILTVSAMIINASMGANGNYLAILIQKTGGDVSKLGILWFIVAMSEIPAFYLGNKIFKRFNVLNVYITGLALYSVRFFIDSLSHNYEIVLGIQIMQSVTYTLYTLATLQYINSIVPTQTKTTALTLFAAFAGGIGGFLGNYAGGYILQNYSIFYLYRVMSYMAIAALVLGIVLKTADKKNMKSS